MFLFLKKLFVYWLCRGFIASGELLSRGNARAVLARASRRTARALGMAASVVAPQGLRVVAHELSCRATCGIFPDRRSNGCPLRCKAGSSPVDHQGSPQPQLTSASLFCCLGSSGCMFPLSVFGEPRRSQVFFGSSSSPADDPQRLPVSFRSSVCPAPSKCEADG